MSAPFIVIGHVDDDLISEHFTGSALSVEKQITHGTLDFVDVTTKEELAVHCGLHPSKGQARKNGMSGDIPFGISRQGTKQKGVWVWRGPPSLEIDNLLIPQEPTWKELLIAAAIILLPLTSLLTLLE